MLSPRNIFVTKCQILFTCKVSLISIFLYTKEPLHIIPLMKELTTHAPSRGTQFDFVKPSGSLLSFIRIEVLKNIFNPRLRLLKSI